MLAAEMETTELSDGRPEDNSPRAKITISRPAYTQSALVSTFNLQWEEEARLAEKMRRCVEDQLTCTAECWRERLRRFFPCVSAMRHYQWRSWLVLDLISGLSNSVVHIPQGMGFALLASVPPVYGLYSSFFPPLIYFVFGTSRHLSMGTMALVSLMIGSTVNREAERLGLAGNGSGAPANETDDAGTAVERAKVGVAVSVSLLVGCFQFLMGVIGLGAVATFMSMPFIGSFLTAAAVHIITSQIPAVLGLNVERRPGLFKLPLAYQSIFYHIEETNMASLVAGFSSLVVLVVLKNVVNERCRSRMKVPIPAELIVVAIGTLTSHYLRLNDVYGMKVIGTVPTGIPSPEVPPMTGAQMYIGDALIIAVISFVISISMAKLMAKKHSYAIDVNQELFAYGLCFGISSFFRCFAGAQAPPRTLLHDSVGGKTQLSSLFSCVVVLLVCLFMGSLFVSLPVPVLAAIIIVALLPMFKQFQQLPTLWRVNKYDFFVWVITFVSAVLLDITSGLIVGMATSIFLVVFQAHFAVGSTLVSVNDSDVFLAKDRLLSDQIVEYPGVRVFRFNAPLFFVNVEKFKMQLYEKTLKGNTIRDNDPRVISVLNVEEFDNASNSSQQNNLAPTSGTTSIELGATDLRGNPLDNGDSRKTATSRTVILDCSAISYIDIMGINMLKMVSADLGKLDITFSLACVSPSMVRRLDAASALSSDAKPRSMFTIYPTVQDAVAMETMKAYRK